VVRAVSPPAMAAAGDEYGSGLFRRCAWAVEGAQQVLLFVGIGNDQEHEGIDRHNTSLPGLQVLRVPLSTLSTLAVHSASATPQHTACRVVPIPPEQRNAVGSSECAMRCSHVSHRPTAGAPHNASLAMALLAFADGDGLGARR
jgi:hypothetical protein